MEDFMHSTALQTLETVRDELLAHPMYAQMNTPERVRILMKHHVFAVWDFMTLLKRLQREVTSVDVPWLPYETPAYTRFINEIVLAEESDEDGRGGYTSHFQLYLEAMEEVGADTAPIHAFLAALRQGKTYEEALQADIIPSSVRSFVSFNMESALHGKIHEVAAVFFYGREDLIPDMFRLLVDSLEKEGANSERLDYYLRRHIELDEDEHGPLARKLLDRLCEQNPQKIEEALQVANQSLIMRSKLWDGVLEEIRQKGI
jgi:hypothetical protein